MAKQPGEQEELEAELTAVNQGDEQATESSAGDDGAAAGQADSAEATSVESPAAPSFRDRLLAKGIKVEGEDDDAAIEYLAKITKQAQASQPYVDDYRRNYENYARFRQWEQQQAHQQQLQQQAPQKPWWSPPEFDKSYLKYVDRSTGGFKEGTPLHVQEAVQKYVDYQNGFSERFLENPAEALKPWAEDLKREWLQEAQQQFQQSQYQQQVYQEVAQIGQQHPWMWQSDAEGQPIINPATNQKVMTDVGAQVIQQADMLLRQAPTMHWPTAVRMAIAQVKAGVYEPYIASLQNGHAAQQTNGDKKVALLNGQANRTPSRRGSLNGVDDDDGPLQKEESSFEEIMRGVIAKSGKDFSRILT